jgi:hypothetical protein
MKFFIRKHIEAGERIPDAWIFVCQHGFQIRFPVWAINYVPYAQKEMKTQACFRYNRVGWNTAEFLWYPIGDY